MLVHALAAVGSELPGSAARRCELPSGWRAQESREGPPGSSPASAGADGTRVTAPVSPSAVPPPAPRDLRPDGASERRNPTLIEYLLVAVAAAVLGIMAVPSPGARGADSEHAAELALAQRMSDTAEEIRAALGHYEFDHQSPAGYEHPRRELSARSLPSERNLRRQMAMRTNEWGTVGAATPSDRVFGPYLAGGPPVNPVNRSARVRVLADDEDFPAEADGQTGWIYKPLTGELRPNAVGTVPRTSLRYYDL